MVYLGNFKFNKYDAILYESTNSIRCGTRRKDYSDYA